jgi:hypothetical protein
MNSEAPDDMMNALIGDEVMINFNTRVFLQVISSKICWPGLGEQGPTGRWNNRMCVVRWTY